MQRRPVYRKLVTSRILVITVQLLYSKHFDFQKGHSTEHAIGQLFDKILESAIHSRSLLIYPRPLTQFPVIIKPCNRPCNIKVAATDIWYFRKSTFSRKLIHKKNFSFTSQVVFKLGYLFCQERYNLGHNILRLFDVLPIFSFTTSEMNYDY